jgi:hypothetical protein
MPSIRTPNPGGVLIAILAGARPIELEGKALRVAGELLDTLQKTRELPAALGELGADVAESRVLHDSIVGGQIVVGVHGQDDRAALARQVLELSGGEATQAA